VLGGVPGGGRRRLDLEQQVRGVVLERLEAADGPAELDPGLEVVDGDLEDPPRAADLLAGQRDERQVEGVRDLRPAEPGEPPRGGAGEREAGQRHRRVEDGLGGTGEARRVRRDLVHAEAVRGARDDEEQGRARAVRHVRGGAGERTVGGRLDRDALG